MESTKFSWSWKEGSTFALCWKLQPKNPLNVTYKMNIAEKLGISVVQPLYATLHWLSRHLRKPIFLILITLSIALLLGIAFYHIPAFIFLEKIFTKHIIRFVLFAYTELLFLGMGCKAYGRFHNLSLIELWKKNQLTPIYPGILPLEINFSGEKLTYAPYCPMALNIIILIKYNY